MDLTDLLAIEASLGTNKIGVWGLRPQRGPGAEPLALLLSPKTLAFPPPPGHIGALEGPHVRPHRNRPPQTPPPGKAVPAGQPDPAQTRLDPRQSPQPPDLPRDPRPDAR